MYNRKAFKQEAKQLMRASVPHFMLVALVYVLLTTGVSYAVTWLTGGDELLTGVLSIFLNILVGLFSIVMAVGFANYTLRLSRREETGMGSLFYSFSFAGRSIGVQLLSALFMFLWSLLVIAAFAVVVVILIAVSTLFESMVWRILMAVLIGVLYIVVTILIIRIALRYAMVSFALADDPDAGTMEVIRRSIQMMRGYKGKYFVLELSFLGWELLVALIACIVMGVGVAVGGVGLFGEDIMELTNGLNTMDGLWMIDNMTHMITELTSRLGLWPLLAEVLSLPLTLWLLVYRQTAAARFYNYVCGYDYHQYMNQRPAAPGAPLTPPVQEPQQPTKPSEPGNPLVKGEKTEQPETPPASDNYYTSILPPECPDGAQEEPDDEEEI